MSDTPIMDEAYNQAMDGRIGVTGIMNAACKLERELAEAKAEVNRANADALHWEAVARYTQGLSPVKLVEELTAHKAALEKCEKALTRVAELCEDTPDRALMRPSWMREALDSIANLKYRLLTIDDTIMDGDEFRARSNGPWLKLTEFIGEKMRPDFVGDVRRRINLEGGK